MKTSKTIEYVEKIEINEDGSNLPSELRVVFSEFNQDEDSYKEMERLRLKAQEVGYDFDYDLSGQPTEFMEINKMAKGGRTISIVNDGVKYDKSKYKAVYGDYDKDGVVNIDDANPLNKNKKGKVEEIELKNTFDKLLGVKAELDEIMYDAVDTLDEKAPKGADIYARTKTPYSILKKLVEKRMLDPKRGLTDMIGTTIAVDNQKELVELRDKIDNGLLGKVLDRDDFYKRPNAGYRAYHYIVEYKGVPVEVQLKTKNMKKLHEVAHKSYKLGTLNPKTLNEVSIVFMKADKGDAKSKVQMEKLLSNKKQLISKISK
jgi:ppGpp synthetase/RelA/SpoT-type nucleotidyltranferase